RVARAFGGERVGWVAGLLMLIFPAAVEAVVWTSGMFDLAATTFVLLAILAARKFTNTGAPQWRVATMAACVAAGLCKETGVVAPALIAVDAWTRRQFKGPLRYDVAILLLLGGVYGAFRFQAASDLHAPALSKYVVQKYLFVSFGGLLFPWHSAMIA